MKEIIIFSFLGLSFLILACGEFGKKKKDVIGSIICFLIAVALLFMTANAIHTNIPNGLPPELKSDGIYEIRVVDVYTEKDGQWIAFQIIKEQGKATEGRLPYKKISKSKFGNANIVYGIPMTIELKTKPSQQDLVVKDLVVK